MCECILSLVNVQFPFCFPSFIWHSSSFHLICLFFSSLHLSLCLLCSSPISLSFQTPPIFIPDFQHPLLELGPSILALIPLLSLPSACLRPCLSDVKYHPFTHLHLIFSRPSLSPFYLPAHFSHHWWQPSPCAEVSTCFLLSPLVFYILGLCYGLSERAFQKSSVIGHHLHIRLNVQVQKTGKDGGMVMDWFVWEVLSGLKRRNWATWREEDQTKKIFFISKSPTYLLSSWVAHWVDTLKNLISFHSGHSKVVAITPHGLFTPLAELTTTQKHIFVGIGHFNFIY